MKVLQEKIYWHTCQSEQKASSYLDLSVDQHVLYTTSTQNKAGLVVCVLLEEGIVTVCDSVKGTDGALLIKRWLCSSRIR